MVDRPGDLPRLDADSRRVAASAPTIAAVEEFAMRIVASSSAPRCGGCPVDRRRFLAGCAACVAGASGFVFPRTGRTGGPVALERPRVRLVFTHIPSTGPIWPNIGYDFESRKKTLVAALEEGCPDVDLLPVTVQSATEAKKLLESDSAVDGYVVYMLGLWTGAPQVIAATGRPVLLVDDLYGGSGEFLIANAAARRAGFKVVGVSSSRLPDVTAAVKCFGLLKEPGRTVDDFLAAASAAWKRGVSRSDRLTVTEDSLRVGDVGECLERLGDSTILVVGRQPGGLGRSITEVCGPRVVPIEFAEIHAAYEKTDPGEAAQWADRWVAGAEKVVEPSRDEIVRSGAMYLAERELMKRYGAQAISINCLGGFYGGHIKAYPCLGFSQLNDDGLVGGCEADLVSALTMLAGTYLSGRPGYISDPVIDTSKNQIVYAHCVAPTRVFGPKRSASPYHIRSHSEDRKGAVVRSLLPLGYMTTTFEIHPLRKEIILHQGKSVENIDEDKACRTKLAVEVKGDIDRLFSQWDRWGWHRVTFFGDLEEPIGELADAMGMKIVREA